MASTWGNLPAYGEFEIAGASAGKPRLLGEGSFGKTFEACRADRYPGGEVREWVALKVLNPELLQTEEKRFQFLHEVSALAKFKHRNLVHYIRGGQEGDEVYYAMELCMGGDLRKLVHRFGSLPERVVALVGAQVAAGLREVHDRHGLIHRDIKPENIVLVQEIERSITRQGLADLLEREDGLCRIVDFGLVNFEVDTQEGRRPFAGSPMYASPEQIRQGAIDQTTDIYSLGLTLLYLLKGKGPLLAPDGSELKSVSALVDLKVSPTDHAVDIPPWVSTEFRALLLRMISKTPEGRLTATAAVEALQEYLESRLAPEHRAGPLKDGYELGATLHRAGREQGWVARPKESEGEEVRLMVAAWLGGPGAPADPAVRAREISDMAQRSTDPTLPASFLRVLHVVHAEDALAFEEEHVPSISLEELMRQRTAREAGLAMEEALAVLRPVASAFDFLRSKIAITCDDILLELPDGKRTQLDRPVHEWPALAVRLSFMGEATALEELQTEQTVADSVPIPAAHLHAVPSLCRLLYRVLTGAEVDSAATYSPTAYTPATQLGGPTNNYLRDLLCGSEPWTTATETLRRFCNFEGVAWDGSAPTELGSDSTAAEGLPPLNLASSSSDTLVMPHASDAGRPASRSPRDSRNALRESGSAPSRTGTPKGTRSASLAGGSGPGDAPTCEVVRPGFVRSPFDDQQREQEVPPEQWKSGHTVQCIYTLRYFRLPRRLDLLIGTVLEPKWVESPYDAGHRQEVPWELWQPNGEVVCQESGQRFRLPSELPYLEAQLLAEPGLVQSPYEAAEQVTVPPGSWLAGEWIACPATGVPFLLPKNLPPLRALADPAQPGVLRSPYAPGNVIRLDPARWTAGLTLECPVARKPLTTPPAVEQWELAAEVLDPSRRTIRDPLDGAAVIEVPPNAWRSGALFPHPRTARGIRLPQGLSLLVAEIDASTPGMVRSPFSGEWFALPERQWKAGETVNCPGTRHAFRLPDQLPEFPREARLGPTPGTVRSPYDDTVVMAVPAARWKAGELLECDGTHRKFKLPNVLPQLVGTVEQERIGWVYSPHSEAWQQVPFDSWLPRNTLYCERTGYPFKLPDALPEWLPDAQWIPRRPGRVRSPHDPAAEVDVPAAQWASGTVLTCPSTHRRFRLPVLDDFLSLEQERAIVVFAARTPEKTAGEAETELSRPEAPLSLTTVQAIWDRHQLATLEARQAFRRELFPEGRAVPPHTIEPPRALEPPERKRPAYVMWAAVLAGLLVAAALALVFATKPVGRRPADGQGTPEETPEPLAAAATFTLQELPAVTQPDHLTLVHERRPYTVRVDRERQPGSLSVALPETLRRLSTIQAQLQTPGWSAACQLVADKKGGFTLAAPAEWTRITAPLWLSFTTTDYNKLIAQWVRALPKEPAATAPPAPIEIPLAADAEPAQLPTGIYKLTLAGNPARVKPWVLAVDFQVTQDGGQAVQIPRSIAGDFWGLWASDKASEGAPGTFLILRPKPKAAGIRVEEVEITRGSLKIIKEFRWNDKRPMIGATSNIEEVKLVSPTKLSFRVAIQEVEWDVVFETRELNPQLVVELGPHQNAREVEEMRKRRFDYLNSEIKEIQGKGLWNMFRDEDAKNLQQNAVQRLGHYGLLSSPSAYASHYEKWYVFLKGWSAKAPATVELYPLQTILYPNPPDVPGWDATPTKPNP